MAVIDGTLDSIWNSSYLGWVIGNSFALSMDNTYASVQGVRSTGRSLSLIFMSDEQETEGGFVFQYSVGKLYM